MMNLAEFASIAAAEEKFWWYRGMRRILFAVLDPLARSRHIQKVLEAGCGTGYNAAALRERYGWRTYPPDLQMEGLKYAKALGVTSLIQGDVATLPFQSGAFDAVICLDVIVHFPPGEEGRALAEFARVLAPGGLLMLRVSALDVLCSRHSQFTCERHRFTARRLMAAVLGHGIQVLRCTYANTLLVPLALAKFRIWEPVMRTAPQSGVRPIVGVLNGLLAALLASEGYWLRSGLNLQLGQSLIFIGEKQA